jgi:5'-nucleotidase
MLQMLSEAQVPVLVFSAGIGDILEEVLIKYDAYFPNIKIISNYMVFDRKGMLIGFKSPIIHTFNKNEAVLGENKEYFTDFSHRQNVILLGDSDGDADMGSGMENTGDILKIGFLNSKVSKSYSSIVVPAHWKVCTYSYTSMCLATTNFSKVH